MINTSSTAQTESEQPRKHDPSNLCRTEQCLNDFHRNVLCLCGFPVDDETMETIVETLFRKTGEKPGPCVLATINVNWVVQALRQPDFRRNILNSDLITIDGRPLLWLAKLLDLSFSDLVPGSTLIEHLWKQSRQNHVFSIYLFGGEGNSAQKAYQRLKERPGGLVPVGAMNPGFGPVEEMSRPEILSEINASRPDLLLVALGAKKGTDWIEHNRTQLAAKIVSHLGATINFIAGTVRRAPKWMQYCGIEWIWRIIQEPKLFSRYASDGFFLAVFSMRRLPAWLQYRYWKKRYAADPPEAIVRVEKHPDKTVLVLGRRVGLTDNDPSRTYCYEALCGNRDIVVDFADTVFVESDFLGLLLILMKWQRRMNRRIVLANMNGQVRTIMKLFCVNESKNVLFPE